MSASALASRASMTRRCSGVYSSSAAGSLGRMVITPPATLNSRSSPFRWPAFRRTEDGTTSGVLVLFSTVTVMEMVESSYLWCSASAPLQRYANLPIPTTSRFPVWFRPPGQIPPVTPLSLKFPEISCALRSSRSSAMNNANRPEQQLSGKKVHDARLVAMNVHRVRRILTFNTYDGRPARAFGVSPALKPLQPRQQAVKHQAAPEVDGQSPVDLVGHMAAGRRQIAVRTEVGRIAQHHRRQAVPELAHGETQALNHPGAYRWARHSRERREPAGFSTPVRQDQT